METYKLLGKEVLEYDGPKMRNVMPRSQEDFIGAVSAVYQDLPIRPDELEMKGNNLLLTFYVSGKDAVAYQDPNRNNSIAQGIKTALITGTNKTASLLARALKCRGQVIPKIVPLEERVN